MTVLMAVGLAVFAAGLPYWLIQLALEGDDDRR